MGVAYRILGGSGATPSLSLVATTRTLRIIEVRAFLYTSGTVDITPYSISGAGHSGGTVLTPAPLRVASAAPPATATARANSSVTGTATQLGYEFSSTGTAGFATLKWQSTVEALIYPGFGFRVASVGGSAYSASGISFPVLIIHFEELQLDWSL